MIKVRATDCYIKNTIQDKELGRIPEVNEVFEVSEERLDTLLGDNDYGLVFVEVIPEVKKKVEKKAILKEEEHVEKRPIQE